jgi:dihydroorotase
MDPARVLGLDTGHLGNGQSADICVFDPQGTFDVSRESLKSQGKNTPFLGLELPGRVRYTLISGALAYDAGLH